MQDPDLDVIKGNISFTSQYHIKTSLRLMAFIIQLNLFPVENSISTQESQSSIIIPSCLTYVFAMNAMYNVNNFGDTLKRRSMLKTKSELKNPIV